VTEVEVAVQGPGNVVTPFQMEHPNQLLLELLKQVAEVDALVVIARDRNGRLYVSWTEQDDSCIAEASQLLSSCVSMHLYSAHAAPVEEDEKPALRLSFLANGELEPLKK